MAKSHRTIVFMQTEVLNFQFVWVKMHLIRLIKISVWGRDGRDLPIA